MRRGGEADAAQQPKLSQDGGPPVYENPISLKVMRLSKPKFHFGLPVPFNVPRAELPSGEVGATSAQLVEPALSGALALPHSFGDIYLGETFSCFVSLANKSALELVHVQLKVEVRTEYNRESISEERSVDRLSSRQTLDKVARAAPKPGKTRCDRQGLPTSLSALPPTALSDGVATSPASFTLSHPSPAAPPPLR